MKISYEQLESYHGEIANIIANMKNIIDDMNEICKGLNNNGVWNSQGATHYVVKYQRIITAFETLYDGLNSCNAFLEKCYNSYQNIDSEIMKALGNLGS